MSLLLAFLLALTSTVSQSAGVSGAPRPNNAENVRLGYGAMTNVESRITGIGAEIVSLEARARLADPNERRSLMKEIEALKGERVELRSQLARAPRMNEENRERLEESLDQKVDRTEERLERLDDRIDR